MSRSGYSDDYDGWDLIQYRGRVASAIRGKRGQKLLLDLVLALDAMPEKRLIADELERDGEVCALGAVGRARGVDVTTLDLEDTEEIAGAFNVADCLAREVMYMNDEVGWRATPEERWARVRAWAISKLEPVEDGATTSPPEQERKRA